MRDLLNSVYRWIELPAADVIYCSGRGYFMTLQSGDVISTAAPPGVGLGQNLPRYLRAGLTMRLGITGLGIQQQRTIPATRLNP
jgi:2-keto-4-pentenoate hydratase/2-oxohepta-3-ene-1,7-dioic acid hydratase in catechol pathway